jgi:epoxyqueuosine reductase QueG
MMWRTVKINSEAEKLATEVKEYALKSGASLVGIVSAEAIDAFPSVWVGWTINEHTKKTTAVLPSAKSVVVMGYNVWDDMLEMAIKKDHDWVYPGYFPLDVLTLRITRLLEKKGYETSFARSISHKRLAQLAGFGNYGKNALIINPVFGPWIRLAAVLTNAELAQDKPFEKNLCGKCENCIKACPVGALTSHEVDDTKCLVGIHLTSGKSPEVGEKLQKYEPSFTRDSHLMCVECQKACKYGKERHSPSFDGFV